MKDGTRRITQVTEVLGMEGDIITLQDVFAYDFRAGMDERGRLLGTLHPTGLRPRFVERLLDVGIALPTELFVQPRGGL